MLQKKKVTMEEVAQALGVSKTTVSRALSGKGRVGTHTRKRVQEYIRQCGGTLGNMSQEDDVQARNLALVIPSHFIHLDLPFLRKCMGGVCRMAAQRGYDVLLCYADDQHTEQLERQLRNRKVDGVILTRTLRRDPCIDLLHKYHVPFVAIGRHEDAGVLQVDNDQAAAAAEMTRLLLQLGMKRIAYMGGSLEYTVNADRLSGYLSALQDAGITPELGLIYSNVESEEKRVDDLEAALERNPDCLLCCDDNLATAVLKELQKRGVAVPAQMRLASLYDSDLLEYVQPAVSAVNFDAAALGVAACRLLMDSMEGKTVPGRIVQGHQVILRASTK